MRRVSTGLAEPKGLERGAAAAAGCTDSPVGAVAVFSLAEEAGEEARRAGGRSGGGSVRGARLSLRKHGVISSMGAGL